MHITYFSPYDALLWRLIFLVQDKLPGEDAMDKRAFIPAQKNGNRYAYVDIFNVTSYPLITLTLTIKRVLNVGPETLTLNPWLQSAKKDGGLRPRD